jgi:hypothetical protein
MNMPNDKKKTEFMDVMTGEKHVAVRTDKLRAKRRLTLDATSIVRLGEVICQATGELELIDMPGLSSNGEKSQAWAIPILDGVHQTNYLLICNVVMVGAIRRAGEPSGGKYFAMRAGEIRAGKRFRQVDVIELELAE